jgi:uncharacterized protein
MWRGVFGRDLRLAGRVSLVAALAAVIGVVPGGGADAAPTRDRPSSAAPAPNGQWQPHPATYGDTIVANVPVMMNDDVTLVGDVIYPTDPATGVRAHGKFPVLLTQNPYNCDTTAGNIQVVSGTGATYFVDRGYIFASICVRGTGRSGGTFDIFSPREQRDGVELVHWAVHDLDGSNSTVGLTGCSYLGLTQLFTAGALPPDSGVKAMLPSCAGAEIYRETAFSGGMPTETLRYFRFLGALAGPRAGAFGAALAHDIERGGDRAYFNESWKIRTPGTWAQQIVTNEIPALLWSGWNDIFTQSSEEMYAYLQNAYFRRPLYAPMAPGQRATGRYQIIVGPWGHGQGIDQSIELEWFDTWLKGRHTGMAATSTPMHLYQLGSGTWINTADYPMVASYTPYYLNSAGTLTPSRPTTPGVDSIAYTQPAAPNGSITYATTPFPDGATLAGPISATLYASSSSTNINLIAELDDVAPGGTSTKLTSGSLVGSLRALDLPRSWFDDQGIDIRPYGSFATDHSLVAGKVYTLSLEVSPRVAQLAPGHSLRLTITTQMPATGCGALLGVDPCFPTAPQVQTLPGTYQVEHSPALLSAINLPLLPHDCFPASGGSGAEPDNFRGPPRPPATPCTSTLTAAR